MKNTIRVLVIGILIAASFGFSNLCSDEMPSSQKDFELLDQGDLNSKLGVDRIKLTEEIKQDEFVRFMWEVTDEKFPSSVGEEFSSSAVEYLSGEDIFSLREFCKKLIKLSTVDNVLVKRFKLKCVNLGLL